MVVDVDRREALAQVIDRRLPGPEFRAAEADAGTDAGLGTMTGHFAVFNQWTEIDSLFEGRFLERIAPGAFKRSFDRWSEARTSVKVMFNHGLDPSVGEKLLGVPTGLTEDDYGARYEVPLFDTAYNRDLLPGLTSGAYGSSFRFRVTKEEFDNEPERSPANPEAIPQRTIKEVDLFEFGPVSFPAYDGATAGMRSDTDVTVMMRFLQRPDRLRSLLATVRDSEATALPERPEATHSQTATSAAEPKRDRLFRSDEDWYRFIAQR